MKDGRAHLVHVVHRFDTGGMENGLVNLVNRLPADRFRHTIVPLTEAGRIATRITNPEVRIESLGLTPGPLARALPGLWRLFRRLCPSIVHTRNVGTLEAQIAALLAGVPVRIHGEHGWEVHDLVGSNASLLRTRRWLRHLVHAQVALSAPTSKYLRDRVGVPVARIHPIYNGVDTCQFRPRGTGMVEEPKSSSSTETALSNRERSDSPSIVIGYVGRLADVKNPLLLVDAFERLQFRLRAENPTLASRVRLRIIGGGPLANALEERVAESPERIAIELAGVRDDIARCMRDLDIFALPSLAEGISNTLLEAMASALPCIATSVGGNDELIEDGVCGTLVATNDAQALSEALVRYVCDPRLRESHGSRARARVTERFAIDRMLADYEMLYTSLLLQHGIFDAAWAARPIRPSDAVSHFASGRAR